MAIDEGTKRLGRVRGSDETVMAAAPDIALGHIGSSDGNGPQLNGITLAEYKEDVIVQFGVAVQGVMQLAHGFGPQAASARRSGAARLQRSPVTIQRLREVLE